MNKDKCHVVDMIIQLIKAVINSIIIGYINANKNQTI